MDTIKLTVISKDRFIPPRFSGLTPGIGSAIDEIGLNDDGTKQRVNISKALPPLPPSKYANLIKTKMPFGKDLPRSKFVEPVATSGGLF